MNWLGRLVRRTRAEAELDGELRDHLERQVADLVQQGHAEPEARRLAALELGGIEQIKEQCRDARGTRWVARPRAGSPATASGYCASSGVHRRRRPVARARHRREHRDLLARQRPPAPHPAGRQALTARAARSTVRGPTRSGSRCATGSGVSSHGRRRRGARSASTSRTVASRNSSRVSRRAAASSTRSACARAGPDVHDGRRPARRRPRRSGRGHQLSGSGSRGSAARPTSSAGRSRSTAPVHDHRCHAAGIPGPDRRSVRSTSPCRSAPIALFRAATRTPARLALHVVARHHGCA